MAKMFYTIDEAAERLGKSADDVQQMADSGQLQEFRDGDRLMFKKEQVDLLAGGEDDVLKLGDDLEPLSLSSSGTGTGLGLDAPSEGTGISIFDPDDTEQADPSAQTQVTDLGVDAGFDLDSASSGSGLLDLTQEADDTSLGADLLDDVYASEETMGATAPGADVDEPAAALFEGSEGEADAPAAAQAAPAMMAQVAYDGMWSGIGAGLSLGIVLCCGFAIAIVIFAMVGAMAPVSGFIGDQFMIIAGGMALALGIFAVVGMVVGKKS